ncbi:ubiquitin carboxyl-terminal hydrolase 4 [Lentinula raphanica]|nr:ubiquitin carboxyl-terminal hydrolase 4 [Lentinula raphanica]
MPISVLPTPPDFPPSKPPTKPARTTSKAHVNHDPADEYTAVDIDPITALKEQAKSSVQSSAKGFSALALLKSARDQYLRATTCENQGDLKGALVALTKAAGLTQMVFRTAEWGQNGQNAVKKELMDLKDKDLTSRMQAVEAKLRLLEKENTSSKSTTSNEGSSVSQKSGGSIADRMKALQNSGLSITTASKRFSKDLHTEETPISATSPTPRNLTSGTSFASTSASSASSSSSLYGHAFVSPSTLGPPSPESSPSSSPTLPIRSFSSSSEFNAFNAQFPSIDELNEADGTPDSPSAFSALPSIPTGRSATPVPLASPLPALNGTPQTPHATLRNFIVPVLERPSSTPSTPLRTSGGIWDSRPGSPTPTANPPPLALLNRPSGLSTSRSLENSDAIPQKNICTPKELYHYLQDHEVILLDVRERAEFEKGHIVLRRGSRKVSCAVCIEPSVLQRENVTSDTIEDSLSLAPTSEASAFNNRHKFELLVLYDQNSTSFNMSILLRAIWEREFKKTLRRTPMMLVGGYDAWVKEFGIEHMRLASSVPLTETSTNGTIPSSISIPPPLPSTTNHISQGRNPFAPGGPLSSHVPVTSSNTTTSPLQPIQPSLSRHQTGVSPSVGAGTRAGGHKANQSMDQGPSSSARRTSFSSTSATNGAIPIGTSGPMTALPEGDMGPTIVSGATPITYPVFSSHISYPIPLASSSSATIRSPAPFDSVNKIEGLASPPPLPPQASINPSVARRRTSDYVDQSQEALSGMNRSTNTASSISRKPIDYPELSSTHPILRPPPAAAAGALERQENIKRYPTPPSSGAGSIIPSHTVPTSLSSSGGEWTPRYWADSPIGTSGLKNMGNTCYMNAPIQCLSATVPFARFFTEVDLKSVINYMNKMNSKGQLTKAFSRLVHDIWHADMPYITPNDFRRTLCSLNAQYMGTSQHDSQEFLSFLLDGIHEDTNRIMSRTVITRTPAEEERLENMPQQIAGEYEWQVWRQNNDSIIVDFFQGMFRNQLRCMKCEKTSTTYNAFSILSVPVPARTGKIPLQNCLKAFFNVEVMEGDDAWDCPRCKSKRRATKTLSLARLPPVLVIHLKRFEANGRFSDKIDTFVDFPIKGLDLTELMPPPLPVGADQSLLNGGMVNSVLSRDDPRIQLGPYKYELYAVTNHFGNLSSGHYTAFVASRGGWLSCDDSSVKNADIKQVVNQKAYVLFYKRVRT